jgi:hypothetical protein
MLCCEGHDTEQPLRQRYGKADAEAKKDAVFSR